MKTDDELRALYREGGLRGVYDAGAKDAIEAKATHLAQSLNPPEVQYQVPSTRPTVKKPAKRR